jgi:hypothetical protein
MQFFICRLFHNVYVLRNNIGQNIIYSFGCNGVCRNPGLAIVASGLRCTRMGNFFAATLADV